MIKFLKKEQSNPWQKASYSQTGEDLIVKFIFDVLKIQNPTYIDIGAHHPFHLSNTALLSSLGSKGINIEPDPELFALFPKHRPLDINLNCGLSNTDGELLLYVLNAPTMNTFSEEEANRLVTENNFKILKKIPINVFSINTILNKYFNNDFPQFMNLDVEGLDEQIIKSINFEKHKPLVICIETISYSETGQGIKNYEIINYLKTKGYMLFADTHINSIFVTEEAWLRK